MHRLPRLALAALLVAAASTPMLFATESEHGRIPIPTGGPRKIADPAAKMLDRALRTGRATAPRHRAWYDYLVDRAPYDRKVPDGAGAKAAATHRANLARRAEAKAAGKLPNQGSWTNLGPNNVPGRMTAIVVDPTNHAVVWVGGADGGVWKSTDTGSTWANLTDFEGSLSVGALALDPGDPNTLYVGTGEGNFSSDRIPGAGILKTTDGGATWRLFPIANPWGRGIRRLDVDPVDRTTLFAAADNGLLRSTDAGATWTLVDSLPSKSRDYATDVVRDPGDSATLYAAFGDVYAIGDPAQTTPGIWRSTDRGTTWAQLGGGFPTANIGRIALAVAPSQPGTIFAGVHNTQNDKRLGIWVSTDSGATWAKPYTTDTSLPDYCSEQCWYDNVLAVDPADPKTVYAGGLDVYRTMNGGAQWSRLSTWYFDSTDPKYVHADQHHFATPAPGEVWVASDGGVARSTDKGLSWTQVGRSLVTAQYYSLTGAETTNRPLLGGLQDNGTVRSTSEDGAWAEVYGGDGGFTAVDPTNTQNMLTEYVYVSVAKSTDGGRRWSNAVNGINQQDRALFITPFVLDPANPQRLLLGTHRAYLTTTFASSWVAVSPSLTKDPTSGYVSAVAFDPTDAASGWAGTTDGSVQVTRNLGPGGTWTNLAAAPMPARAVRSITVDPTDGKKIFVTFSGYDEQTPDTPGHVFRSTDGGTTWKNVSAGLPDHPVRTCVVDPDAPSTVWIGTDLGIYGSSDGGSTWAPFGDGLPNVSVQMLQLSRSNRKLRAGTHGRGAWEIDVPLAAPLRSTIVPVATHSAGANGTFYVTDVRVVNTGATGASADLVYTPNGSDSSAAIHRGIDVPAGNTKRFDDVVLSLFGVEGGYGRLEIRSTARLVVSARTYNSSASGTFGQFEPGADASATVSAGGGVLHLLGVEKSTAYRTNLGLVETAGIATRAVVAVYDETGTGVGSASVDLPAGGMTQVSDIFAVAGVPATVTRARIEVSAGSGGSVGAYASVVDNQSGDAVFVPARPAPNATAALLVGGAAKAGGSNGSFWRTDLNLLAVAEPRTVKLAFLPGGQDGSAAATKTIALAARESRRLADVIGDLFGATGAGALRIDTVPAGQGGLLVTGRTYTVDSAGASYGQFVGGRSLSEAPAAGVAQTLAGMTSTGSFRTNVGFVNGSGTRTKVDWIVVDAAGAALATGSVMVEPWSQTTVNDLHVESAGSRVDVGEARVDFTADGSGVLGWMSVVDNRSNDPILVPSQPRD